MKRTIITGCYGAAARARAMKFVREASGYHALALFRPSRGEVRVAERFGRAVTISAIAGAYWSATMTIEDAMAAAERKHATRATAPAPSGAGS